VNYLPRLLFLFSLILGPIVYAGPHLLPAVTEPIPISDFPQFSNYSQQVQDLIIKAKNLSEMHLTYLYGSSDPKNLGMDCSGTIYYLLSETSLENVPRSSDEMYAWVEKNGKLYKVKSNDFNSPEFSNLQPGDLLFWTGTYVIKRTLPITHVMLYLGKNKRGEPLMFGASDGRTYQGKKMWGVSVFDFKLPDNKGSGRFVGYGCIPYLTCDKK